jgi:DNA-binding NarL/FixJ family response regulator
MTRVKRATTTIDASRSVTIAELVPEEWRAFMRSGEYMRTRAFIHSDGAEARVDLAARFEFVDERSLAIEVKLPANGLSASNPTASSPQRPLTKRERAVVALIAAGQETREIAETLNVSRETVRSHVRNSMSKHGAHTRAQLVASVMSSDRPLQLTHAGDRVRDKSPAWGIAQDSAKADS